MIILKTSLCLAAAAALVNFWLGWRIGALRSSLGIWVGDGGNDKMIRRMRAQANYAEWTPIVIALFALVELAGRGSWWLAPLAAVFVLGRVAHAFGMDGNFNAGRTIGMATTVLPALGLGVVAVMAALGL